MSVKIQSRTGREDRTHWTVAIDMVPGPNDLPPTISVTWCAGQAKLRFPVERDELELFLKEAQTELERWGRDG